MARGWARRRPASSAPARGAAQRDPSSAIDEETIGIGGGAHDTAPAARQRTSRRDGRAGASARARPRDWPGTWSTRGHAPRVEPREVSLVDVHPQRAGHDPSGYPTLMVISIDS